MNFRHVWNIFAVVIILLVIGTPFAMAQDATEEAPAGDVVVSDGGVLAELEADATQTFADALGKIILVVVGAIGSVQVIISGAFAVVIALALNKLFLSTPPNYQPTVANVIADAVTALDKVAKKTTFTWDDDAIARLREELAPIIAKQVKAQLENGIVQAYNAKMQELAKETP